MYNRFEKGERSMERELVKNLAHVYGISEDENLLQYYDIAVSRI